MKKVDYIIVGSGYAAVFFAHQLIKNDKNFILFADGEKSASRVSAGIINPVVLKKFTTFWLAQEQINVLHKTLAEIHEYTGENYLMKENIHRIFHDEKEAELWKQKAETQELIPFLDTSFKMLNGIKNPYGTGKVNQSARLDVSGFFDGILGFLKNNGNLREEKFSHSALSGKIYKDVEFENIVFCEGMKVTENPFFRNIPVNANKGHHLKVKLSQPVLGEMTLKKKHFLFPFNSDEYYYGGTYDRNQLHSEIDDAAVEQLSNGLTEFYPFPFEISGVEFGFRPTVKDRRPILGSHLHFPNYYVFNGLGARGILNGCYFARHLYDHIENKTALHPEVDLRRFEE